MKKSAGLPEKRLNVRSRSGLKKPALKLSGWKRNALRVKNRNVLNVSA